MNSCPPEGYALERIIPMDQVVLLLVGIAIFFVVIFGFVDWLGRR